MNTIQVSVKIIDINYDSLLTRWSSWPWSPGPWSGLVSLVQGLGREAVQQLLSGPAVCTGLGAALLMQSAVLSMGTAMLR